MDVLLLIFSYNKNNYIKNDQPFLKRCGLIIVKDDKLRH